MRSVVIMGVESTNKFVRGLSENETLLIVSVGQTRTTLPDVRPNIVEFDCMMLDLPNKELHSVLGRGRLFDWKVKYIADVIKSTVGGNEFDYVIVRCDAGLSRSQAVGSLMERYFNENDIDVMWVNNSLVGEIDIVKEGEKVLCVGMGQKDYEEFWK